jgi:hypothetical protein
MNMLFYSHPGSAQIAFTRSPEVAAHFAFLDRDNDEGTAAVFVFSRSKLRNHFRLEPFHDPIWDTPSSQNDEMEERIWRRDIREVSRYLLGVAMIRTEERVTPEKQRLNHLLQEQFALRAQGVEPASASELVYGSIADLESRLIGVFPDFIEQCRKIRA